MFGSNELSLKIVSALFRVHIRSFFFGVNTSPLFELMKHHQTNESRRLREHHSSAANCLENRKPKDWWPRSLCSSTDFLGTSWFQFFSDQISRKNNPFKIRSTGAAKKVPNG